MSRVLGPLSRQGRGLASVRLVRSEWLKVRRIFFFARCGADSPTLQQIVKREWSRTLNRKHQKRGEV